MSFLGIMLLLAGCLGAALGVSLVWPLYKSEDKSWASISQTWIIRGLAALVCGSLTISLYLYIGSPKKAQQIAAYNLDEAQALQVKLQAEARTELNKANKILDTVPKSPEALARKAISAAQLGQKDIAIAAARDLVELDPDVPDGLILLAGLLIDSNDGLITPEAKNLVNRALEADPNHPRALYLSAEAAWQIGNTEKAMEHWSASFATGQGEWQASVGKRMMTAAEEGRSGVPDPKAMANLLKDIAAKHQSETQAQIEEMVTSLANRLAKNPKSDAQDWLRLVRSYMVLGEMDKVRTAFEDGLAAHPTDVKLLLLKAQWLRNLTGGETSETLAIIKKVLSLDSTNVEALWFMAVGVQKNKQAFELAISKLFAAVPPGDPRYEQMQSLVAQLRKEAQP